VDTKIPAKFTPGRPETGGGHFRFKQKIPATGSRRTGGTKREGIIKRRGKRGRGICSIIKRRGLRLPTPNEVKNPGWTEKVEGRGN